MDKAELWLKCGPLFFWRRDYLGNLMWPSLAQLWRRKRPNGEWEYRQDELSGQDQIDWQI